jgi:trans-AT polyketide synthase/acyltransferase/oxidoreductase domain-containing protein
LNTVTNASLVFDNTSGTDSSPLHPSALGKWIRGTGNIADDFDPIETAVRQINRAVFVIDNGGESPVFSSQGTAIFGANNTEGEGLPIRAYLPRLNLQEIGDSSFCRDYDIKLPYMAGSMANGIASTQLVKAITNAGMLASFGAAGLGVDEIESAIFDLKQSLTGKTFAFNLIHSPNEKGHEDAVVDLYLQHGIDLVEASAYLKLTLPVVRYRVSGIQKNDDGKIICPNRIIAKASRIELARHWFSPPPAKMLIELVSSGHISEQQAELASHIPMAQDLTVEADSGGHTDNRPAITLIPTIIALKDKLQSKYNYTTPLRVGAAGGIATPASAAAAFSMGAAYIVTGTINQACKESGSSDTVRQMLAQAEQADVTMAPAVDMFEMGVKLQVLKRGTMFAMRGNKLYETYRKYNSIEDIPTDEREAMEKSIFKKSLDKVWIETRDFFLQRNPAEVSRAEEDPKHKMALVFRWYLGLSSRWANSGKIDRQVDYQIWCGPAMGAFNEWVKGSALEQPENREVVNIALNLMYGAALVIRLNQLQQQGIRLSSTSINFAPLKSNEIESYLK